MLSDAMITSSLFLPEACALARIGEKSGTLGQSLESAAQVYSDTMQQSMQKIIFFLQPAVILLLGFLITALIFAVYLPIMQLSHVL
jgi:type II secretory pathway component PulF